MKSEMPLDKAGRLIVAPLVGAWIEIGVHPHISLWGIVAPLVGAWIEISNS